MVEDQAMRALADGFTRAFFVSPSALEVLEEVRGMCAADRCRQFGRSWSCPPACGTLRQCAERLCSCRSGLLVQTVGQLEDDFDLDGMDAALVRHRQSFLTLAARARLLYPGCLPLAAGACAVCAHCAYPEPCRAPEKCHPSMEAFGLLVSQVCQACGAPYHSGQLTVTYTSCILY